MQTKLASKLNGRQDALAAPTVPAEQDDGALVLAASRGSDEAFEVLIRRHQARILRVAWRFTRTRHDAEDITQQTLQKAFVHLRQFEGGSSFSTWLTRIAMNEGLMWLRRKRSSEVQFETPSQESQMTLIWDPPDPGLNPEEAFLQLEHKGIVTAAVNKLTPKLQTIVRMQGLGELSMTETARMLGLSVGTAKARLFRGRRKLRAMLKQYVGSSRKYGKQALRSSRTANDVSLNELACACD